LTGAERIVTYAVRENPETGIDEVVVAEGEALEGSGVRLVRDLGVADGTRYVHALVVEPAPEWEGRWTRLTLDYAGPFAGALVRDRVVAYVTRKRHGRTELLTIEAPDDPEGGAQVPAGRLDHGESLEEGLLRELAEETGFTGVRIVRELPEFECSYPTYNHNHAFHVEAVEETPESWRHQVHGDGVDAGMIHVCRWVELTPDLELWGAPDPMLAKLVPSTST
jgi:8-oxo-dGTP pyrophosphatase MutT (NUDIX family)